ncbi:MAG: PIN domain-containing protein [Candidatus Jordarchaeaceae archaeon]
MVDSYAWIELFIGGESSKRAEEYIEMSGEVYTPDIVLAKVARKYLREGFNKNLISKRLKTISESSRIAPINPEIALGSAECYVEFLNKAKNEKLKDPSLFDATVLAVTKHLKAKGLTGDEHFKNLPETLWLKS